MPASKDVSTETASSPTEKEIAAAKAVIKAAGNGGPPRFKAVVSLKGAGDRVLFSSVSEKRTKKWIEDHCPRGQHVHLQSPDGSLSSYEHERHAGGPQGEDVDVWQEFDRDEYQAPDLAPVNTADPWADAWEGAQ